ncbi:MAG TPA: thiol-disulfide oxidoreductase DCC family protein [Rubricoccaceae bacterium]|jgi:predicted DCC family thiol-disulfide oxidoreductase YuxK
MAPPDAPVVLFDGECALCDASVRFILDHDSNGHFHFASLQSDAGRRLAADHGVDASRLDTLVLVTASGARVRSDAALAIARSLGWPWSIAWGLRWIPRPVRDAAYRLVALNRIRLFGRLDACRLPTPDTRARFLDL